MLTRLIYIVMSFMLLMWGIQDAFTGYKENREFAAHGLEAETEQIRNYESSVETRKKRHHAEETIVTKEATIKFVTADNQKISVKKKLPDDVLAHYNKHDQVNIVYLSTSPENIRWIGEKRDVRAAISLSIISAVALSMMLFSEMRRKD